MLARLESSSSSSDIIILDDCIASGDSAIDVYNKIKDFPNCNGVSMYSFVVTKEGLSKIAESAPNLQVHYDGSPMLPVRETEFYNSLTLIGPKGKPIKIQQDFFVTLLEGAAKQSQYSSNGYAIMFEHMAPNNNNIFASNMILQLFSGPRVAVKNSSKRLGSIPKNLQYPPAWLIKTLGN